MRWRNGLEGHETKGPPALSSDPMTHSPAAAAASWGAAGRKQSGHPTGLHQPTNTHSASRSSAACWQGRGVDDAPTQLLPVCPLTLGRRGWCGEHGEELVGRELGLARGRLSRPTIHAVKQHNKSASVQAGRQARPRRRSGWPAVAGCAHHFHGGLLRWGWCGAADAEGRELLRHGLHAGLSLLLLGLLRRGALRRGETHPP